MTLAGRQPRSPLAHLRVETLGEGFEALEEPEGGQCLLDLGVGGLGPPDPHVVAQRSGEEESLLGNHDDALAQRTDGGIA